MSEVASEVASHLFSALKAIVADLLLLERNTEALSREAEMLRDMRVDVESTVQASGRLTHQVRNWMESVDALTHKVAEHERDLDRGRTGCPCSGWFSFKLGRGAAEKLREARQLREEGAHLGVLVGETLLHDSSTLVGRERTLSAIRDHLSSDHAWVVGIYGMGGAGKTFLLKKINNELLAAGRACPFDAVMWVTVSREREVWEIQDAVGAQLGLHSSGSWGSSDRGERAQTLFKALGRRRFLLLLDDLWAPLDLTAVGIPHPTSQRDSKIAFTSRSEQVCREMEADVTVRVGFLDMEDSWKLFNRCVGSEAHLMRPHIRPLAQKIVRTCGGLPLALVVVGRALADAKTADEWKDASLQLTESAEDIQGMDQVLSSLKLSYDRLNDDSLRQCLLYCSLFPEGHQIPIEELIDYWVGEGLLLPQDRHDPNHKVVHTDDIDAARNRGRFVVQRLKATSLLKGGAGEDGDMYVEMHDAVRDMALWISTTDQKSSLLVAPHRRSSGAARRWLQHRRTDDVLRISLMGSELEIGDLLEFPHCPKLLTLLFCKNSRIDRVPRALFSSTPALRVLDLSDTKIEELPDDIGVLTELRYLNLSDTLIQSLPQTLGNLKMLEQLDLRHTVQLATVPRAAILSLARLQELNLYNSGYRWPQQSEDRGERGMIGLKDLDLLPRLNDLRLDLKSLPLLSEILSSARLSRAIRYLTLQQIEDLDLSQLPVPGFGSMSKLRELCIDECSGQQELAFGTGGGGERHSLEVLSLVRLPITKVIIKQTALESLQQLHILGCHTLKDLSSVHHLPRLQYIDVRVCNGLEALISATVDDKYSAIFPQLRRINLRALPNFKCIYHRPLFLPRLEFLEVYGCPMFVNLRLDAYSARNIKQIVGTRKWCETLQWDEEETRSKFLAFFKDPWQEEEEEEEEEEEKEEKEEEKEAEEERPGGGERSGELHKI